MTQYKNILIRTPNWIGDQVLAYPFFHFLRESQPQARIAVVCVPWVGALQFRDCVDEVYEFPRPADSGFLSKMKVMESTAALLRRNGPWDLGLSLPDSLSSAWLLFRSGARIRRGYDRDGRGLLLNDKLFWDDRFVPHRADAYAALLPDAAKLPRMASEFWGEPPKDELDPGVPGILPCFDPEKSWAGRTAIEPPAGDYWVLAPGSNADSRRWSVQSFMALARKIAAETGWPGVVVGGPAEAPLADELCEDRKLKLLDRVAQGPVPALWKIFRNARFTVSNDSGLAHVASLCGSPVHIVWGAGMPQRTRPIGPGKVTITLNPVECWPCEKNSCLNPPESKLACLRGIEVASVWKEIEHAIRAAH